MKTPLGIELAVGQKWRELDRRVNRVVTVTSWNEDNDKVQLNGKRWALLKRFNAKGGGYVLISDK